MDLMYSLVGEPTAVFVCTNIFPTFKGKYFVEVVSKEKLRLAAKSRREIIMVFISISLINYFINAIFFVSV